MNGQVADYRGLVESIAARLSRYTRAQQVGAEYDDLVQEGLINVWQSLERGVSPIALHVENRMKDWIRHLAAQQGIGREEDAAYEALLPLDDFRVDQAAV